MIKQEMPQAGENGRNDTQGAMPPSAPQELLLYQELVSTIPFGNAAGLEGAFLNEYSFSSLGPHRELKRRLA